MRPNSEGPGRSGAGRQIRRRARLGGVVAALVAAVLLAAGCSSSSSSSSSSSAPAATASSASAAASGSAAPGTDVGLTATTIKVGMIADVNNPLVPGLFKDSVNAVNAWAAGVNASGGLAGRKVVVDFCDSQARPQRDHQLRDQGLPERLRPGRHLRQRAGGPVRHRRVQGLGRSTDRHPQPGRLRVPPGWPATRTRTSPPASVRTARRRSKTHPRTWCRSATPGTSRRTTRACMASGSTTLTTRRSRSPRRRCSRRKAISASKRTAKVSTG